MDLFKRRNRHLNELAVETDVDSGAPVSPQVIEEGSKLFEDFIFSQMERLNLSSLLKMVEERPSEQSKPPELCGTASRLHQLASSFSQTDERKQIKEMAMKTSPDITGEEMTHLLLKMYTKSTTMEEGIVAIFFFCFDMVALHASSGLIPYLGLINLCKDAIINTLGPKVQEQGGWSQSISSTEASSMAMGLLTTGIAMAAKMGMKSLFDS